MSTPAPAELLLGLLLRHVDDTRATIWVETDRPAEVVVTAGGRRASARTWGVHGHQYAILVVTGLTAGSTTPYEVHLEGEGHWPEPESPCPPSLIRTLHPDGGLRLAFGSCRRSEPLDAAGTKAFSADALVPVAAQVAAQVTEDPDGRERPWPDTLLFVGDQIYGDEPSAALTARYDDASRGSAEGEVGDFEEYTWLYREAWVPAPVRWLLSRWRPRCCSTTTTCATTGTPPWPGARRSRPCRGGENGFRDPLHQALRWANAAVEPPRCAPPAGRRRG